jgi:hypothetical protein
MIDLDISVQCEIDRWDADQGDERKVRAAVERALTGLGWGIQIRDIDVLEMSEAVARHSKRVPA